MRKPYLFLFLLAPIVGATTLSPINPGGLPNSTPTNSGEVSNILGVVLGIIGALALLMIIVSGLRYTMSGGNPERASKAKSGIIYSLVGLAVAISAEAIVAFVVNKL